MKTLRAALIKAGYKSMSIKRTDVPGNERTQNRTQELSEKEIRERLPPNIQKRAWRGI